MEFAIVILIIIFVLTYRGAINSEKLYQDNKALFGIIKEKDYDFLVKAKYGSDVDPDLFFEKRIKHLIVIFFYLEKNIIMRMWGLNNGICDCCIDNIIYS